ncbi:MAG: tetratricopeptide repeat protein [Cyanophyceae cyanobacterium]
MSENLTIVYLAVLLVLLSATAVFIFRQVLRTRRVENTFSKLQNKLKQEKGTAKEYYQLASLYLDKKLFVQANNLLQKALKEGQGAEPENRALIYNALGYSYFAQEQYDLAIRQYREALKLNSEYVVALNNLGNVYERKQLTAQALAVYEQALQLEPDNTTAKRRAESLRKRMAPSS